MKLQGDRNRVFVCMCMREELKRDRNRVYVCMCMREELKRDRDRVYVYERRVKER